MKPTTNPIILRTLATFSDEELELLAKMLEPVDDDTDEDDRDDEVA